VLGRLAALKKGRCFVGISGTVGSGKSQWAKNLQTLAIRLKRRVIVVDEDYFIFPVQQRLMIREELYSKHECWIDWSSFWETIRQIRNDHGTYLIHAYDRGAGDRSARVALEWDRNAIVLVAGLYCLTPLHEGINYDLQIAFTTTPEESAAREQAAATQTGRRSREDAQQLISEVYNPLRERLREYILEERKFPDIEFDVTIEDKPRVLVEDPDGRLDE
jgi:uridine kinase